MNIKPKAPLFVGRAIAGITGAGQAVAPAYIADVTSEADRARRFGQLNAVQGLGFIAGPVLGGLLGTLSICPENPRARRVLDRSRQSFPVDDAAPDLSVFSDKILEGHRDHARSCLTEVWRGRG
jgi:Major Facilitator Superfamily